MNNLHHLVVRDAYDQFIPYQHRTSRNALIWFWVKAGDADQVERDLTPRVPRPRRPADDTRELDGTCTYAQDTRLPTEVPPRTEETIIVAARPAPFPTEQPTPVITPTPPAVAAPETAAQRYRGTMINPGSAPVADAREELAAANLHIFVDAVREQALLEREVRGAGGEVADPVRDPDADRDGRYGWTLTVNGVKVSILMPGVHLTQLHDMGAGAPCLQINGNWWWWPSAVGAAVPLPARQV